MGGQTIHHHDQLLADPPPKLASGGLDLRSLEVLVVDREVQPDPLLLGRHRQTGDHAQPVTAISVVHHRLLAPGHLGAAHQRLKHQARLIEEQDATTGFGALF